MEYHKLNIEDIKGYIRLFLNDDQYKDALRKWIDERNINANKFIEQVAEKSENNFMYLRYVLPEIARGLYNDLTLQQLPAGLENYYQIHWIRMEMDDRPKVLKVKILFVLVEVATSIPCEMIADILEEDKYEVELLLDEWVEYVKPKEIEGESCYGIYHKSFLDFLKSKRALDSPRKLFKEVNQSIADYYLDEEGEYL